MLSQLKKLYKSRIIALIHLLPVIVLASNSHDMSSDINQKEDSLYCSLLHVPEDTGVSVKRKAFLGIMMALEEGKHTDTCTTFIRLKGIVDESPAEKAGLQENDIILTVNDMPVCKTGEDILGGFKKIVERHEIDSKISIHVLRNGERLFFSVRLDERPFIEQPEAKHEFTKTCGDGPSYLKEGLIKEDQLSLFKEIRSDLLYHSNQVHNSEWFMKNQANHYQLDEFTYMIRHPLQSGEVAGQISDDITAFSENMQVEIWELINKLSRLLDLEESFYRCKFHTLSDLIELIEKVSRDMSLVLRSLSVEETTLLREHVLKPWSTERWNEILDISGKIELKELIGALYPLISCLTEENLSFLRENILTSGTSKEIMTSGEIGTSFGKVFIGGLESDTYTEDAALILDPGGNDVYLNNAGGTRSEMPVALVIDWEGNDLYLSKENFSQGAGVLGGGFLLDLGGNNVFNAMEGAQGVGFYGIGILYNEGSDSTFLSRTFSQGVGQFGIGVVLNRDKNSLYQSLGYGQALGLFNGAGILFDMGGNDYYLLGGSIPDFRDPERATVSMGQGFGKGIRPDKTRNGVSGGIGVLIDKSGDDMYLADYFAQGSSYFYGIGILNDNLGNDQYFSGRYSQGAGIHSSVGIFIEKAGDDTYHASHGVAQGMGHDYGTGFFEDFAGDDRYYGGTLSQGAATYGGLGILLDRLGRDRYTVRDKSQAFADNESCMGIMLDLEPDNDTVSGHSVIQSLRIGTKKQH